MIAELFSPFQASKLSRAVLVLAEEDGSSPDAMLEKFAYSIVQGADGAHAAPGQRFLAERYGGIGIRSNGGGARCGVRDGWLVKGMGCNQLLGEGMNFWSSHGSLSLADAAGEYIWARLLDIALPHGAVATPAVIASGGASWTRGPDGDKLAVPGALMVRQAAYRLASFERALYFRPARVDAVIGCSDVARVRAALAILPRVLPAPPGLSEAEFGALAGPERLRAGLLEAVRRFGAQFAAASAKRIMHGSMASSNIALDGRWMDLGSITGLPRFGIRKIFRPSFWAEYTRLIPGLQNIVYYLDKYGEHGGAGAAAGLHGLEQRLRPAYYRQLSTELVIRSGFPEDAVRQRQDDPDVGALGALLITLAQAGTSVDKPAGPDAVDAIGSYAFGAIVWTLASSRTAEQSAHRLAPLLRCARLATTLTLAYRRVALMVRESYFGAELSADNFRRLCGLRAAKAGKDIDLFSRPVLNRHIQRLVRDAPEPAALSAPLRQLARRLGDQAEMVLRSQAAATCTMWREADVQVRFDACLGRWRVGARGVSAPWEAVLGETCDALPARAMRQFWGADVFEALT